MNAMSLYVSTGRLLLQAPAYDQASMTELKRLLPLLRTALSCSVCSQILSDPMTPEDWTSTEDSHRTVCRDCVSSSQDPNCNYVEDKRFRTVLLCFKKLYEFVVTASYSRKLQSDKNCATSVANIIYESLNGSNTTNSEDESTEMNGDSQDPRLKAEHYDGILFTNSNCSNTNGDSRDLHYGVTFPNSYHHAKITTKRKSIDSPSQSDSNPCPSDVESVYKSTKSATIPVSKTPYNRPKRAAKKGCRCGNATATPGNLTCCGQRCPCYVVAKACVDCRCKGCRNPHMVDGLKIICKDRGNINNNNSVYFTNNNNNSNNVATDVVVS